MKWMEDAITDFFGLPPEQTSPDAIPIEWIRQQAENYPGMESAMWNKLIRLWEGGNNGQT